eukprot:PLAT4437.3.p2 GENE.PLAT4437.3~~PLAT4437.3.p2  ORF type:complete len:145 (-),score=11.10 PLAT4437.3:61-432(-)
MKVAVEPKKGDEKAGDAPADESEKFRRVYLNDEEQNGELMCVPSCFRSPSRLLALACRPDRRARVLPVYAHATAAAARACGWPAARPPPTPLDDRSTVSFRPPPHHTTARRCAPRAAPRCVGG